jgi:hypothetical protein
LINDKIEEKYLEIYGMIVNDVKAFPLSLAITEIFLEKGNPIRKLQGLKVLSAI